MTAARWIAFCIVLLDAAYIGWSILRIAWEDRA